MAENGFVHLHLHTEYSLLDGLAVTDRVIARAKELSMHSIAITDHGNLYGAIEFYKKAKAAGLHPIIGCEVYVARRSLKDKNGELDAKSSHLVLLCENNTGYQNLMKLVSIAFTEGFYYKPRIDMEILKRYSEGLIMLSACINGEIPRMLIEGNYQGARREAEKYLRIFDKNHFYLELQNHGIPEEETVRRGLIRLANELGIGLTATNDVHYVKREDAELQDILMCIQTGKTIHDTDRMKMQGNEFYFKSQAEMEALFPDIPEAITNTAAIAERCQVEIEFGKLRLPSYDVPGGGDHFEYLKKLTLDGYQNHYPKNKELLARLQYELETIRQMGYTDYFLIVWDYVHFAKQNGIAVGPGRGSAAGSLVSFCLEITTIDPIQYDLLFERFLNPERVSMPDIDVDFCYERRSEVIEYVVRKYGSDHVAQIITFGTLKAKAAVRDVGRALDMKYADVDVVAKLIPFGLKMTIRDALAQSRDLRNLYDNREEVKRLLDTAIALEGLPRHASTHAAGVVITKNPVSDYVPLQLNDDVITTQYTMGALEELGILKMDFLGLRNLTVIQQTIRNVKQSQGIDLDMDQIDYNDPRVYDMICAGDNECIFQLEGGGAKRQFIKELKPRNLEDIIAAISLYRPGPMKKIPEYIKNRADASRITYPHPALKKILDVTCGCIIYQEQVMQIFREVAGYSFGRADVVRRAMSKKKPAVIEQERHNFLFGVEENGVLLVDGALRRGMKHAAAEQLFDEMLDFAGYAFNKSHAAAYAFIAYQTAYLKALYPAEYMASMLSTYLGNMDTVAYYIEECKKRKIAILPPDVNQSSSDFSVENGAIRFSLNAVKNVGGSFISRMATMRESGGKFKNFEDFLKRMAGFDLNKRCVESLIKCGAFDSFGMKRSVLMESYERILDSVNLEKRDNVAGQLDLFGIEQKNTSGYVYPDVPEFHYRDLLAMEKEVTGIYLSGHPLDEYKERISGTGFVPALELFQITKENEDGVFEKTDNRYQDGDEVSVCGIISYKKEKITKNGTKMATLRIEDLSGEIGVLVFPGTYQLFSQFQKDEVVVVKGTLSLSEDEAVKLICRDISYLPPVGDQKKLYLKLDSRKADMDQLTKLLKENPGVVPVCLYFSDSKKKVLAHRELYITPRFTLIDALEKRFGRENVKLV